MKLHRPEREIQKAIADYLTAVGIKVFRMNVGSVRGFYKGKTRFIRYGTKGMADLMVCPKNLMPIWVECKSDSGKLSMDQKIFKLLMTSLGHRYIVARSVDDVRKEL